MNSNVRGTGADVQKKPLPFSPIIFTYQFPKYDTFVIPGFRKSGQDNGRPKAGLAQFSTKSLNIKKNRVKSNHFRVQGQVLNLSNSRLLLLNAYFPVDSGRIRDFNEEELTEVYRAIEDIIDNV